MVQIGIFRGNLGTGKTPKGIQSHRHRRCVSSPSPLKTGISTWKATTTPPIATTTTIATTHKKDVRVWREFFVTELSGSCQGLGFVEDWSPDWWAKECEWPQQQEKKKDVPSPPLPPRLTLQRCPWYCRCTSHPWLSSSLQKLLAKPCIEVRQELMYSCPHLLQNLKKLSCPPRPLSFFLESFRLSVARASISVSVYLSLPLLLSLMLLLLGLLLLLRSSSLVSDLVFSLSLTVVCSCRSSHATNSSQHD